MKKIHLIASLIISIYINQFKLSGQNYVTLQNNEFKLNGSRFFVKAVNYQVDLVYDQQGNIFASPNSAYDLPAANGAQPYEFITAAGCSTQFVCHFNKIKAMGFNAVRIFGALEFNKVPNPAGGAPKYEAVKVDYIYNTAVDNLNSAPYTDIFSCIQTVLDAAAAAGIKVQLLVGSDEIKQYPNPLTFSDQYYVPYLQALSTRFANNTALYSYDFINEPNENYSHSTKSDICGMVESWHNAIHSHDPYHLTTIGLEADDISISKWDPGFLKLDFLSYHIYPATFPTEFNTVQQATDRVINTIKWCSEVSTLPWMIGETSFAASAIYNSYFAPVNGSLAEQQIYARNTLNAVRDCGGIGYSWWQFQDTWGAQWGLMETNFTGKPLLNGEFSSPVPFDPNSFGNSCVAANNFFNFLGHSGNTLTGSIVDQNSAPIKNAVIRGWHDVPNPNYGQPLEPQTLWKDIGSTFSDSNGGYTFSANDPIDHVAFMGVGTSVIILTSTGQSHLNAQLDKYFPPQPVQNTNVYSTVISGQTHNYEAMNIDVNNSNINSVGSSDMKAYNEIHITEFQVSSNSYFCAHIGSFFADCGNVGTSYSRLGAGFDSSSAQIGLQNSLLTDSSKTKYTSKDVFIYPNPSNEIINIQYDDQSFKDNKIEIYDAVGHSLLLEKNKTQINVSQFEPGFYSLRFKSDNYERTFKITIQH